MMNDTTIANKTKRFKVKGIDLLKYKSDMFHLKITKYREMNELL